jgi:signal transduction histidine kinase
MSTSGTTTPADLASGAAAVGAPASTAFPAAGMSERDLAELLGAFNDVTGKLHAAHESLRAEVVRLQRELRQANEQIERSRRLAALGEMAAGIAHEVRNPLGSIRLYARMLTEDLKDREAERRLAEKIAAATRGLDAVVTDVLAFAREMRVRPEPAEAWGLVERALEECLAVDRDEGMGKERSGVRVVREGSGDGPVVVGDPGLLHRALVNVIRNAVQAMRDAESAAECRLTLGVDRRTVTDVDGRARPYVVMTVRDAGPGIPPEVMGRMFNPFFTTRATGTGLGLAIVHRIVDAHGGRVRVRNVEAGEGRGAVVELLLPDGEGGAGSVDEDLIGAIKG